MAESARILLVEDEKNIRDLMALHLLRQGYQVNECESANQAIETLKTQTNFDLMIVDWMMPGLSGVEFVKGYKGHQPILMVTAKSEPQDIVEGLESGADDYLTKPFDPAVLVARVKALLRRRESLNLGSAEGDRVELNGLVLNSNSHETLLNGETIHLTPSEFKLLFSLVQNHGRVLTRDQLIDQIQGEAVNVIGRTIDTHVFGIRKKLGSWGDYIETIRGVGYRVKHTL